MYATYPRLSLAWGGGVEDRRRRHSAKVEEEIAPFVALAAALLILINLFVHDISVL